MAYVNVRDWSVDQVTDWLKGLDSVILQYNSSFLNNGVTGHQLLNLRADDLEHLGVRMLGHQEIILEAVEHLRNFHFELDKENLQTMALRLSCAANSLFKELLLVDDDCSVLQTQVMSDVHNIIAAIKPLVYWLDRSPFIGDKDYIDNKTNLLQLSFEMATSAHRGIFSEKPVYTIRSNCEKLSKIADYIIQDIMDPMILQPASLDLATLKKKEQELGFFILPHNHAVHQIADIKHGSPAHVSTKIEEGDEIVQVNYQTVVGWQRKKVMILLQESPPEIVLTLKKRPRHTKVYGQIYMKPYRLPSRKRSSQTWSTRWNDNIPSPRLLPILDLPPIIITKTGDENEPPDLETELSSSDSEPPDSPLDSTGRMYPLKPRPILKRRNTITGATPTNKRPYPSIEQYWDFIKRTNTTHASTCNINSAEFEEDSKFLRDKSASCNVGLDIAPRPTTVIGLQSNSHKKGFKENFGKKKVNFEEEVSIKQDYLSSALTNLNEEKSISVNSLQSLNNENISFIDEGRDLTDRTSMISTWQKEIITEIIDAINMKPLQSTLVEKTVNTPLRDPILAEINVHSIIKKFDEQAQENTPKSSDVTKLYPKKSTEVLLKREVKVKPVVPPRSVTTKLRARLDKSHSTPAYDLSEESETCENSPTLLCQPIKSDVFKECDNNMVSDSRQKVVEAINPIVIPEMVKRKEEARVVEVPAIKMPPKPPPRNNSELSKNATSTTDSPTQPIQLNKSSETSNSPKLVFDFLELKPAVQAPIELKMTYNKKYMPEEKPIPKYFEPKLACTPATKMKIDYEDDRPTPVYDLQKSTSDTKVSPTHSLVKAMISKGKSSKKKNYIAAKRRKVGVSELSSADIQGCLYQRLRGKHNQNVHWERRWFVLMGSYLYGFKTKEDTKAVCLIFLSGFTVAVANEVKSKLNAFKVYHTGTVFYFSAEDADTLQQWIDHIRAACLHNESLKQADASLYSETDDSDSERPQDKTDSLKKFGSLKKFSLKKTPDSTQSGSTSLDRKWFFNKSSGQPKNVLPTPTSQFRSYRKMRASDGQPSSITTGNFTSHVLFFSSQNLSQMQHISVPNLSVDMMKSDLDEQAKSKLEYIHASNPSLCSSELKTPPLTRNISKPPDNLSGFVTLEELMNKQTEERKMNPHHIIEATRSLHSIESDVVYGQLPIHSKESGEKPTPTPKPKSFLEKHDLGSSCFGKRLGSLKKNVKTEDFEKTATYPKATKGHEEKEYRSLPRTHKVQDSYDALDHENSVKVLPNEMVYCPRTENDVHYATNRTLDDMMLQQSKAKKGTKLKKQLSFSSNERKSKISRNGEVMSTKQK